MALPGRGQTGAKNGEWRAYAAEEASTKYSPLDQITRDNVKTLEVAWTFKIDNFGSVAQTATNESTPIMVGGKRTSPRGSGVLSSPPIRVLVKRYGPGDPTRVRALTQPRAKCTAGSHIGLTARTSESSW